MKMRKCLLALAALLITSSAYAAFGIFQTYLPGGVARVQKNLVSDYGASCNAQTGTKVVSISSGAAALSVSTNTFVSGDVGKTILVPGAGSGGNILSTTIATFVNAQNITLGANASTTLTSSSQYITWATNDTAAFLSFKAAFQGATPVQLNLPGNCSFIPAFGSDAAWTFDGITDLIVAGNGAATSAITTLSTGGTSLRLGTKSQYSDSLHSVRTDTANAGDSCVILKTAPAVTVSSITNSAPPPATFTGVISGTTLTASSVTGTIAIGAYLNNANSNVTGFTTVVSQSTGAAGGAGTYVVSVSQTVASQTFTTVPATFTASVDAAGVMTVSAVTNGALVVGMNVYRELGIIGGPTTIKSQLTGSGGSTGTYQLSNPPLASNVASLATPSGFIGNGVPRVTLNSTTGLTTGDTIYLTGISASGALQQRTNGLQWIKVVNGTQIDLFQRDFNGLYISGGTGGGDRTTLFPIGAKVLMTGWTNQAYWSFPYGQPTNPHYFEWKTVTSNNSTTHQVCFDTVLANTYKSGWPQMNTGNLFEMDPGGPATLYVYPTSWDATIVIKDLTIDGFYGQSYSEGRNVTFQDTTMTGVHCPVPTQNETYTWLRVDAQFCSIETDKIVKTWNITDSTVLKVTIQSSAFDTINVSGSTIRQWAGSPKKLNMDSSTITYAGGTATDSSLQVGVAAYGASDESIITNTTILNGVFSTTAPSQRVDAANRSWSMSSGVITIPNAYSWNPCCNESETQTRVFVPGSYFVWSGGGGGGTVAQAGRIAKVIDVTQDVDNIYIQTSDAGGFPAGTWTTNGLSVSPHPAPKFTPSFAGTPPNSALIFNGCPAQSPIFSCQNFTYTGSATGGSTEGFRPQLWGVIDTFTFTNNVPYAGAGSLGWTPTRFGNWQTLKADLTTATWGNTNMINTKLPSSAGGGARSLTSSGATGTQSGDTIPTPAADGWFGGSTNGPIFTASTPSDSPQVTMTLRTNQQLP